MNKQELYQFLDEQKIEYSVIEHAPVYTVEEAEKLCLPHPEAGAKNLFLRDDKKRNYYLLTVRDALPIDLKQFQERIGSRRLSFASEEDLMRFLALKKGAVTPFGVLNDHSVLCKCISTLILKINKSPYIPMRTMPQYIWPPMIW